MNDTNTAVPAFSMVSHYIALAVLFSVYFSAKGELTIFAFGGTLEPTIFKREVGNEANNEDCCLPTHNIKRTKEQIDADKERDRNITEECEKEVQEKLSEAGMSLKMIF
ncbi:hypothetical protein C0J52_04646 [Blattella germanica]|nr:hypothetical protein C0J52_04646 [Blattella germanica]